MIESLIAGTLAKTAVDFLFPKVVDGALQAVGGDAYKVALRKLKGFFEYKFGDRRELEDAESNPEDLIKLVNLSLENDEELREKLEKLVSELQKISNAVSQSSSDVTQGDSSNSLSGNNNKVDQSNNSLNNVNVALDNGNNSGDINIGNRGDIFRG